MSRRRTEPTAASLLSTWTDSDTAMQIVGTSLGVFGAGSLDPDAALSTETPVRNALFDVLLSLVEGGALDMRPTDDGRYAFRWRADYATAGLSPETSTAIDIAAPSPYLAELARVKRERDDALGRADFAEGLAQERERLLRLANVPSPAPRVARRAEVPGLDAEDQSVLDVLYGSSREPEPGRHPKPGAARGAADEPDDPEPGGTRPRRREPVAEAPDLADSEADSVVWLTPPEPRSGSRAGHELDPVIDLTAEEEDEEDDDDPASHAPKWSGYTIDNARAYLWGVDRLADEG